jgi:hypothetical protein
MLWNASAIEGYGVEGSDGPIGIVADFLFEDVAWTSRWLAVDTGPWLGGRRVLLPRIALDRPDRGQRLFPVHLTRRKISDSPHIASGMRVSQEVEAEFCAYYSCEPYWSDGRYQTTNGATRLRSVAAIRGFHIHASDGEIGRVSDFLLDDVGWGVKFLALNMRWWPEQRILISPRSALAIDWDRRKFYLNVTTCAPRLDTRGRASPSTALSNVSR